MSVYVSAPLCADAKRELSREARPTAEVRVRAFCADDSGAVGGSRLAAIGAAARRASEDSASIAYIGTRDRLAIRFSEPVLEEAGIPRISTRSGSAGMRTLLDALRRTDGSGSLREALGEQLG